MFTAQLSAEGSHQRSTTPAKTSFLVLLDLFNEEIRQTRQNLVARRLIRFVFPEVQLCVLRLLVLLHQRSPKTATFGGAYQIMISCGVWDVLAGPFFLPTDPGSTATILEYLPDELSREAAREKSQEVSSYLNRELGRYYFEVIEFFGNSAKDDNTAEVGLLLAVCETYRSDRHLDMRLQGLSSLLRLLQGRWLSTVQSMLALDGCARLSRLLVHFVDKCISLPEEEREPHLQCRNIALRCINLLLSSATSLPSVMADGATLDMLFRVLLDKDLRTFSVTHLISIMRSDSGFIKANQELFFKLFERYLDTMLKQLADPCLDSVQLPTLLLDGLAAVLDQKECTEQQNLFCTAGAFIKITSMIHITPGKVTLAPAESHSLCLSVLRALTSLMAGNEENKDFFAKHIGYDQLKELILISFNHSLPRLLLTSLFDLMLDGKLLVGRVEEADVAPGEAGQEIAMATASGSTLRNPSIASLLFKIVLFFDEADQSLLLDFLIRLASHSSLNRTRLCGENILFQLLEMIPLKINPFLLAKISSLIKLLGEHTITVREVNKLISLLKPLKGDLRPPWIPAVLDILQSLAESNQSPFPVYFDFDGVKSALLLPALQRWPFNRTNGSFTFVTWVCVESFSDPQGAPSYQPRLFSFLDDEGAGMELFFQNGQLAFQCIAPLAGVSADSSVSPSAQGSIPTPLSQRTERKIFTSFIFKPKVWYCIAVSFNIQSRLIGRIGELKLYVDGKLVAKDILKQPIIFSNLTKCVIGSNALVHTPESASMYRVSSLFGQMAEVIFFDSDLDPKFIEHLQTGSRASLGVAQSPEVDASARGEWAGMFDGPALPSARPTIYFSPRTTSSIKHAVSAGITTVADCPDGSSAICFDASPHARDAFLVFGLTSVQRRHLKEILGCISGGIKAVFPVLLLLDKQEGDANTESGDSLATLPSRYGAPGRQEVSSAPGLQVYEDGPLDPHSGAAIAVQTFKFVCQVLVGARDLQQEMQSSNGFMLLSFLLLKVSPYNLSRQLLEVLLDALEVSASPSSLASGTGAIESLPEALQDAIVRYLLFDFNIWIYAAPPLQRLLLTEVLPRVYQKRPYLRYRYGLLVARLLDSMKVFYWSVASPDSMAVDPIISAATKKVLSQRPDGNMLRSLRQDVLALIDTVLVGDVTPEETKQLVSFLVESRDPELSVDVLRFIHKMIQLEPSFLQQLKSVGLEIFLVILDNKSAKVRAQTLLLFQAILLAHQASSAPSGRPRSSSSASPSDLLEQIFPVASMTEFLRSHRLEQATYNALFAILVGLRRPTISPSTGRRGIEEESQFSIPKLDVDDTTLLKVPAVLPALLRLAHASSEQDTASSSSSTFSNLSDQSLQDLYLLLTVRPENRQALLSTFGWQLWLLEGVTSSEPEGRRIAFDMTANIMKVLLAHQMTIKGGSSFFYELECYVRIATENGLTGAIDFFRHFVRLSAILLRKDLAVVTADLADTQRLILLKDVENKNKIVLGNLYGVIFFMLEYLFYFDVGGVSVPSRQEPSTIPSAVSDPALVDDLYTILNLLESAPAPLHSFTGPAPAAVVAARKGVIRSAAVSVIYKLIAAKFYHSDDLKAIGECLTDALARLTRPGHKIVEVLFTFFHALNAMAVSRVADPSWTLHLKHTLFPFLGELFQNFKAHFYALKQFSEHQLAYLEQITAGAETDLSSPLLGSILSILRTRLGDVEKDDLSSYDDVVKQQQKLHKSTLARYRKASEQEAEVVQRTGNAVLQVQQVFSAQSTLPKLVSQSVLTDRYRRAARQWRKVLRALKNERGPWGTKDTQVRWKLDRLENYLRMRLKMKRNYNFNEHRDAVRAPSSAMSMVPESPEDVLKSILPSVRKDFFLASSDTDASRPDLSKLELEDADTESSRPAQPASAPVGSSPAPTPGMQAEKIIFSVACEMIRPMRVIKGILEITSASLKFKDSGSEGDKTEDLKEKTWSLDSIREIHLRRYLLVQSALEIFFVDQTATLFNFTKKDRNRLYNKLIRINLRGLVYRDSRTPDEILRASDLTRKWQNRQISNFEYLMHLNTLAGRTYNDLCQYPIFPWVIRDYTSETLLLDDVDIYRDLSKPVGALNPVRLRSFIERYNSWSEVEDSPPFFYGTHYSSAAVVLYYLIRMEPFTSQAIKLQGGKFDHGDRLFSSVAQCWANCLSSTADVKELIPEFFYQSEFFENKNEFDFGRRHTGELINNVQLPPWAASPEDFVRINRQALESDWVSAHLHEWIDLIFGYKQKGQAAIDAHNVFHYLTYEGSIDLETISDPIKRQATELTIAEFGQTPSQLFRRPHPSRNREILAPLNPKPISVALTCQTGDGRVIWSSPRRQDIVCVDQIGRIKFVHSPLLHSLSTSNEPLTTPSSPLQSPARSGMSLLRQASQTFAAALGTAGSSGLLAGGSNAGGLPTSPLMMAERATKEYVVLGATTEAGGSARLMLPHLNEYRRFALSLDGSVMFSAHEDDFSIRSTLLDSLKSVQVVLGHKDIITCMAMTEDCSLLVTGSRDTSLLVWNVVVRSGIVAIDETPRLKLNGHEDQVNCVALSAELDICVSGSQDRTCNIYSLGSGEHIRTIYLAENGFVDGVIVTCQAYLVVHSKAQLCLHLYTLNGKHIRSVDAFENLNHMIATKDGEFLISGGKKGWLFVRSLFDLKVVAKLQLESAIWSLALTSDERYVMVGLESGKLVLVDIDFQGLKRQAISAIATSRGRLYSGTVSMAGTLSTATGKLN